MASCKPTSTSMPASRALQALRPWLEAHVHEVVEESYAHLLRFQQPRWLLADPQRLAHVKASQTTCLLSFTGGDFNLAYVANRHTIGRTHARVGVTPQWYLGAFSIFARIFFPKLLAYYHDRPLTGMAAVKALIAVMHLDMQLAIILVVDDDMRMRDLVAKVLAREGNIVRALSRAQDVLQALEEGPADLVISDIRMPEMDGMLLLQEVKRLAPEISVLLMTAFGSIDAAVQAIKAGA